MKNKKIILGALLLITTLSACRQESDNLYNYAFEDALVFNNSDKSYVEAFKVLWHGLDQNYALFGYEQQYGLNWDDVYSEYLPQFEALDKRSDVTDDELKELVTKVVAPLHDGHLNVSVKNFQTGNTITVAPMAIRNQTRDDFVTSNTYSPNVGYYLSTSLKDYATASSRFVDYWYNFCTTPDMGLNWLTKKVMELQSGISTTTDTQSEADILELQYYESLLGELMQLSKKSLPTQTFITNFNKLASEYAFLNVPGFYPYEPSLSTFSVNITYALTNENIAYLNFSSFALTPALDANSRKECNIQSENSNRLLDQVAMVWQKWFDAIQYHHKAGDLKGVIIDVRGNGGGLLNDYQYVLGALLPAGRFKAGMMHFKRGTGRFDYSVDMPFEVPTLAKEHVTVTEPIVILTNSGSVSMSEITTQSGKYVPNVKQIGKRTWGGLCPLGGATEYSMNYAGYVGIQDKTPVFCYVPMAAFKTREGEFLDGIGIQPDIEVDFDKDLYEKTNRDSQFERAVEYIVKGK